MMLRVAYSHLCSNTVRERVIRAERQIGLAVVGDILCIVEKKVLTGQLRYGNLLLVTRRYILWDILNYGR